MKVHLVIAPGVDVIAAYSEAHLANAHALTITGAVTLSLDVLDAYPTAVLNDIMSDSNFDDWQETPVERPAPKQPQPKKRP